MTSDDKKIPGRFFLFKWIGASIIAGIFLIITGMRLFQFGVIDDYEFPGWIVLYGAGLLIIAQSMVFRWEQFDYKLVVTTRLWFFGQVIAIVTAAGAFMQAKPTISMVYDFESRVIKSTGSEVLLYELFLLMVCLIIYSLISGIFLKIVFSRTRK